VATSKIGCGGHLKIDQMSSAPPYAARTLRASSRARSVREHGGARGSVSVSFAVARDGVALDELRDLGVDHVRAEKLNGRIGIEHCLYQP
jgi:hypothetical protein